MVYKCCVPRCRGNYGTGPKVMLFSFPKDANLRWKWLSAIHRDNFQPTEHTKVCELHFTESDICRHTECYDEVKGTKLTVKLSRPRLREGAVPSVLPGCPSYLSTPSTSSRESAEERRARLDNEHLLQAIKDSIVTKTEYDSRKLFSTFEAFLQCLERETIPSEWTIVRRSDCVLFLLLTVLPAPSVSVSVVVTNDLQLSAYRSNTEIRKIGSRKIPHKLSNMNDLFTVLDKVKELVSAKENSLKSQCLLIQDILNDMCSSVDEEKQKQIQFLTTNHPIASRYRDTSGSDDGFTGHLRIGALFSSQRPPPVGPRTGDPSSCYGYRRGRHVALKA
ncbi:uncharacterized protein LOC124796100 [Schistocerca piceifrons]|uniref:uncharacterized protein LOC124796100 n=1 Tax=Schistocerca piceifrons TaxID=274613 RepID=UPI001F5F83B5|nr:uncharacterized protein LOC124796100 [Schistocerca piceifrons]